MLSNVEDKNNFQLEESMKKLILAAALLASPYTLAEEVPAEVAALAGQLQSWGSDPALIAAVQAQNAKSMSLDAIKKRDAEWQSTEGVDAGMKELLSNAAAKRLAEMEKSEPFFFEVFLMDNQGANVAMTNKTSDYWQGDEAKWLESFKGGQGAVHIGEVEFDESAQAYLVQISVPVMDGGAAIGAMTIGVNLDEM